MAITNISTVPGTWYDIDFHVHTPSSFDFEPKIKSQEKLGFISLLEKAKDAGIRIFVCSDHNDIDGYFKLLEIQESLSGTKTSFQLNNAPITEPFLTQIKLFEDVTFLPGVELDIRPNIHFIVIFNPSQSKEGMSDFISKAGFYKEIRGNENTASNLKWNFDDLYSEAEKIDAIVIAAHTDSNKGLYEASRDWGRVRIEAFTNENLYAMEFLNQVQRDKIESILTSPDYKRNSRLAFVQSSDFHGHDNQKIGERRTYVRMDEIDIRDRCCVFQSLKRAFRNPDEYISAPGRPELKQILERLNNQPYIESLHIDGDKRKLVEIICACANDEGGIAVIGKGKQGNWVGENEESEDVFVSTIKSIVKSSISPSPRLALQVYPYGDKFIATIQVRKSKQLCSVIEDGSVYVLKNDQPKKATVKEMVDLIETKFIERYANLSITNQLTDMSQKLLGTQDSIDILPTVRKIDNNSTPLGFNITSPKLGNTLSEEIITKVIDIVDYGFPDGDIILLTTMKPRSDSHYLRVSPFKGVAKKDAAGEFLQKFIRFNGEKIIIAPGGGVHYDVTDNIVIGCRNYSPMIITGVLDDCSVSLKFITAYLKSSIAIWYAERCLGSSDLREPSSLNLPIPDNVPIEFCAKVEKLLDTILSLESDFLKQQIGLSSMHSSDEEEANCLIKKSDDLTIMHNNTANRYMGQIDDLFYDFYGLSNKEICSVEQQLMLSGFATFPRNSPE